MSSDQIEKKLIEDYLIEELQKRGWVFVKNEDLERESLAEPILISNFKRALKNLNSEIGIGEEEIKQILQEIKLLPASPEGIKKFLLFFKYGIDIKFEKERVIKRVKLVDFENIERNEFLVSRQVSFKERELRRADIILFVNGLPLVDIEAKSPIKEKITFDEGFAQIKEYENVLPELFKYIQIGVVVGDFIRYFPIVPWQKEVKIYEWKEENKEPIEAILEFLSPERILDILRNFFFIREEKGEITKVIGRYMQYRAVNKIYQRVIKNIEGKEEKNKGLIWHWQGSGKTLTMIFSAHKLFFDKRLENPTIFFIVDRQDLEDQMNGELNALDLNFKAQRIENINHLKEVIAHNNYQGKRGVFLTLIHKFRPNEKFLPIEEMEKEMKEKTFTIAQRKNVICFLDEVHRTQYGLLASQMKKVLKNAFFFGFTGTPIAFEDRNTYLEFGYPLKEEKYLDKYFIDDSLKDGFTVPIVFQERREDLHLEKRDLDWFLAKEMEAEDLDELMKMKISKEVERRLNHIKVFLENENRIKEIINDIVSHFKENVDGKFKAMIVTGSRKACVLYKKNLDKILPENYSEIVMTFNIDDPQEIKEYYKKWREKYSAYKEDEKIRDTIREKFKNEELPKILIVTDMLLTGFDAPILQTMYLDKLLKKHRLLQAIARVNRPFPPFKYAGVIVDYVGILKELKKAFKEYYEEKEIKGIIGDFQILLEKFEELIKEISEIFKEVRFEITRENLNKTIEILKDEKKEKLFIEKYKELRKIFELLGSHQIKLVHLEKYKFFSAVYEYWMKLKATPEEKEVIKKYFEKTLYTIHDSLEIKRIEKLPRFSLNLDYFEKIKESLENKEEKAVNILFALEKFVLVEQKKNPVYKSLSEKVEELVKKWREREIDYDLLLEKEEDVLKEIEKQKREQEILKLNDFQFAIFSTLKSELNLSSEKAIELTKNLLQKIQSNLLENWLENPVLRKNVLKETRQFLVNLKPKYKISLEKIEKIFKSLIEIIEYYG